MKTKGRRRKRKRRHSAGPARAETASAREVTPGNSKGHGGGPRAPTGGRRGTSTSRRLISPYSAPGVCTLCPFSSLSTDAKNDGQSKMWAAVGIEPVVPRLLDESPVSLAPPGYRWPAVWPLPPTAGDGQRRAHKESPCESKTRLNRRATAPAPGGFERTGWGDSPQPERPTRGLFRRKESLYCMSR